MVETEPDFKVWTAWVHRDGWAGQSKVAVVVVGETPKRFRCRTSAGVEVLVPKHAVTKRETTP